MSITRTLPNSTTDSLTLADGLLAVARLWLDGWSVCADNITGGMLVTPPAPEGLGLPDSIEYQNKEANRFQGNTPLATQALLVMRTVFRPGGGNIPDTESVVTALDKLRPTENQVAQSKDDFHPPSYRNRTSSGAFRLLAVIAGLRINYTWRDPQPSDEDWRVEVIARLNELEAS